MGKKFFSERIEITWYDKVLIKLPVQIQKTDAAFAVELESPKGGGCFKNKIVYLQ